MEPAFASVSVSGDGPGVVYADLDAVKKTRIDRDPANPYSLAKVQAGVSRETPVVFLDKRLQGKVSKIYIEKQYLFRKDRSDSAQWCSWLDGDSWKYPLKRSNLGNVPGSKCGNLSDFLGYSKNLDNKAAKEGEIASSHGMQGAKILIKLKIELKDLSPSEIKAGTDSAQLLLQNGGDSLFIMDVPVRYSGAFSSFVDNTLLAQDNPDMQYSENDNGNNALDIKKVNDVIDSINNFNSSKFSFYTYGVSMEKKFYTDVNVGHLTQNYTKYTTVCCGKKSCSTSKGMYDRGSSYTKSKTLFTDFSDV